MDGSSDLPADVLERIREVCLRLPEAYEEQAWVGVRWRIRGHTFAHVLTIDKGWPPAYAEAAGTDGPACVLTLRPSPPELHALGEAGHPYFVTRWGRDMIGIFLEETTDWPEITELLTESYCLLAPRKLAKLVHPPPGNSSY